jgi:DNA-directed RNA polymerase subunit M/transcription elongation factor TFIIS
MIPGEGDNMANSEATAVPTSHACCPRCGATEPVLSLLTAMTRYFACRRCANRWQVAVVAAHDVQETLPGA